MEVRVLLVKYYESESPVSKILCESPVSKILWK